MRNNFNLRFTNSEWNTGDRPEDSLYSLIDDENKEHGNFVAEILDIQDALEVAEYICKAVNNHERMKEALEGAEYIFRDLSYPKTADTIEKILKDIE